MHRFFIVANLFDTVLVESVNCYKIFGDPAFLDLHVVNDFFNDIQFIVQLF